MSRLHDLHYTAPVYRWDEGLPCGNGLLGMLLWGDGHPLNLSLDRSDLWDDRPDPKTQREDFCWKELTKLVKRGNMAAVRRRFEHYPPSTTHPTKVPCGRFTIDLGLPQRAQSFRSHLDLERALTRTQIGAAQITAYVHAEQPLIVIHIRNARPRLAFLSRFETTRRAKPKGLWDLAQLGYPPPQQGKRADCIEYTLQPGAEGMSCVVAWTTKVHDPESYLYITVERAANGGDPRASAFELLRRARNEAPKQLQKSHVRWWRNHWKKTHIVLPDARLERLWYLEMYKLGATARAGTPPIALQGVWTADQKGVPPWRGDYHHDLNTELTYWPVHTAGRIEQSRAFAEQLLKWLPKYQQFAREFYDAPGASVPCSHSLGAEIVPGWAAYAYSRANGAWLTQHLWWHYRYTMDRGFLRNVAYPFIREVARFVASQLRRDRNGVCHLDYSSSPEFKDNLLESFARDSTYDLSLIRYTLRIARDAAAILQTDRREAREWNRIRERVTAYSISLRGGLALWKGQDLACSHVTHAHLLPIFPLGDVNLENGERDRRLIQESLAELEYRGTGSWCGYTFAWLACLAARVREPNRALWALNQYLNAFVSPNSFHLNGDYKKLGVSRFHYRPFTLEGGFAAAHAIHEMLLQSWSGRIRLFPAIPADWREVCFMNLRAEGAFVVSAWRRGGRFVRADIESERGGMVRLEYPAPDHVVEVRNTSNGWKRRFTPNKDIRFPTRAGERYRLT